MKLTDRKTKLQFTTDAKVEYAGQQRAIVVEPLPEGCVVRLNDCSRRYVAPWRLVFGLAKRESARLDALKRKQEKVSAAQRDSDLEGEASKLRQELTRIETLLGRKVT